MGVEKNATYKVHNGTDFDEINFKTVASQVKMASGVDLENGFLNSKNPNGYTILPNGMILQWGSFTKGLTAGGEDSAIITLPIQMNVFAIFSNVERDYNTNNWTDIHYITVNSFSKSNSQIQVLFCDTARKLTSNRNFNFNWIAIGY